MRIALDGMGGDHAPQEIVQGAVEAARESGLEVLLVGPEERLRAELAKHGPVSPRVSVVHASQVVEMGEAATAALRHKRDSSLAVGMRLLKDGQASAFVSAGNTGAIMATALLTLGHLPGIERPAIGSVFATDSGPSLLLDAGANADCKPSHLLQFAHMGVIYLKRVLGVPSPKVALLSIGEEEGKGNQLTREAYALLKESGLPFIGNVEGKDLLKGTAQVVVTDGFTGNVALKVAEGVAESILGQLRQALGARLHYRIAALVLRPALRQLVRRLDYAEYGGAPLLGVNGVVIIGHGRSNARAIKNALQAAQRAAAEDLVGVLSRGQPES